MNRIKRIQWAKRGEMYTLLMKLRRLILTDRIAIKRARLSVSQNAINLAWSDVSLKRSCFLFQLSELEQRVLEAEGRADEAEDKVSGHIDIFKLEIHVYARHARKRDKDLSCYVW